MGSIEEHSFILSSHNAVSKEKIPFLFRILFFAIVLISPNVDDSAWPAQRRRVRRQTTMVKSRLPLISPGGVLYSRATRLRATHDYLTITGVCPN